MSRDRPYLLHIKDSIDRIESYVREGRESFFGDSMVQDAVVRNLEVIGEAAKRLSTDARSDASDVPWKQIAGMRDRLIHHYFGVDLETVWQVVDRDLASLKAAVARLLGEDP